MNYKIYYLDLRVLEEVRPDLVRLEEVRLEEVRLEAGRPDLVRPPKLLPPLRFLPPVELSSVKFNDELLECSIIYCMFRKKTQRSAIF